MLHREILAIVGQIDGSPFGPDAKQRAGQAVNDAGFTLPDGSMLGAEAVLLIWRCVAAARGDALSTALATPAGEFVATIPVGVPKGARPTNIVVAEMINAARTLVVIVGYTFTVTSGVIELLVDAAVRGAHVRIICDRKDGGRERVQTAWPSFATKPEILVNSETDDALAKMHSKMLIVDNADTLITSANFTYHGMHGNIEFGVRLRGVAGGVAANAFVDHLVDTKAIVSAD